MKHIIRFSQVAALFAASFAHLACGLSPSLGAQERTTAEHRDVVESIERLFTAMARRDTVAARAVMAPGSRLYSIIVGSPSAALRQQSDSEFLASLAVGTERLLERIWTPTVLVRGPVASVWAPYDFHVNGAFSHCGVDSFTLVRVGGDWKVTGITYTVERSGCAPSPLGPPKAP